MALSIVLTTVWPEQEFYRLCFIKTRQRNWLLDVTLNALINVLINGLEQLNDAGILEVAREWIKAIDGRRVQR